MRLFFNLIILYNQRKNIALRAGLKGLKGLLSSNQLCYGNDIESISRLIFY